MTSRKVAKNSLNDEGHEVHEGECWKYFSFLTFLLFDLTFHDNETFILCAFAPLRELFLTACFEA